MAKQKPLAVDELKTWRTRRGWTQKEAARWLRVSLRTYQGWEAGRRKTHVALVRLAMKEPKPKKGTSNDPAQLSLIEEAD